MFYNIQQLISYYKRTFQKITKFSKTLNKKVNNFFKKLLLNLFFYANILIVFNSYRGIVSMVAHRSPKPPVRVRVLLPLPQHLKGIFSLSVFIFYLTFSFLNFYYIFVYLFYFRRWFYLKTLLFCYNFYYHFNFIYIFIFYSCFR